MSLILPKTLAQHTDHEPLREAGDSRYGDTFTVHASALTDEMLAAIRSAADSAGEKSVVRVADAIIAARAGDSDKKIPRLLAAPEMFLAYFRNNLRDGWLYMRGVDGHLHAWLVTEVVLTEPRNNDGRPFMSISLVANGKAGGRRDGALGLTRRSLTFDADALTRKRVSDVLTKADIYIETDALREEYDRWLEHYTDILAGGFSEQYRFTGIPTATDYWRDADPREHRKVIHDLHRREVTAPAEYAESVLFDPVGGEKVAKAQRKRGTVTDDGDADMGVGPVPTHFDLRVFDLHSHDFIWVNTSDLTRYEYDKTLRDKIVLPEDQRNLLDILTSDLTDFTGDVIEGKSAGNVVLCKGAPGVGKTLTAEVYSELIERPLYSIHSGNLGVTADSVRENLEETFKRAKRWNAVLLLDEADVFVLERGDNLTQNAIVAEFLRTLEYFDGLLFMTTNRADNIDDAILSRAAAIIDYAIPDRDGIREVWKVQARQQGATIPAGLLDDLVGGFAHITPRDVKMLLRLSLRVAKGQGHDLDIATVARCAMFRGLHFVPGSRPASGAEPF